MVSLLSAQKFLDSLHLSPTLLDRDIQALATAIKFLGKQQLLGLKLDREVGGANFTSSEYAQWQIYVTRVSGALAFLQTQHQSAASLLQAGNNQVLKQDYLSAMARGDKLIGVGFSQLRRKGQPLVKASPDVDGYSISGCVPWVSGNNLFAEFIVGATLADGRELYAIVPFDNSRQSSGGKITIGNQMDLIAMAATNTVSVDFDQWKIPKNQIVQLKPPGSIHLSSQRKVLNPSWFALGAAHGGIDVLVKIYQTKQLKFIKQTIDTLQGQLDTIKQEALSAIANQQLTYQDKLKLRAQAITLAFRCAQAAVIAASGAANNFSSDAGRIYREVMIFSATAQTQDVMSASLQQLISEN